MIKISDAAKSMILDRVGAAPDRRWYLALFWEKGEADSFRNSDGGVAWKRGPDKGWQVQLVDYGPEVPGDLGDPFLPGVRLTIQNRPNNPFLGGIIELNGESLAFREIAV